MEKDKKIYFAFRTIELILILIIVFTLSEVLKLVEDNFFIFLNYGALICLSIIHFLYDNYLAKSKTQGGQK